MREIRVVTPDGYVWFVRRRWARRRMPWSPMLEAAARRRERARQERGLKRSPDDYPLGADAGVGVDGESLSLGWPVLGVLVMLLGVPLLSVIALVLIVAPIVWFPAAGRWLLHHPGDEARVLGGVLLLAALLLVRRPWLVVAEPMALKKPGRAWRVTGWRRAGRCASEVAGSIREGRLYLEPRDGVPVE